MVVLSQCKAADMGTDEQTARSQLRLGFLSVMKSLSQRSAVITTCEGNSLDCEVIGFDREGEKLAVENLCTPTGKLAHAILRTSDIDVIKIDKKK